MAEIAATAASDEVDPKTLRTVIAASSAEIGRAHV